MVLQDERCDAVGEAVFERESHFLVFRMGIVENTSLERNELS